jgi:hypothetical protein
MQGGGEGGIRGGERSGGGIIHFTRGEKGFWGIGVLGQSEFTVEFTVHRGAEEVLGSEG